MKYQVIKCIYLFLADFFINIFRDWRLDFLFFLQFQPLVCARVTPFYEILRKRLYVLILLW